MRFFSLFFITVFLFTAIGHSKSDCRGIYVVRPKEHYRPAKDRYGATRSNAPHFVAWAKKYMPQYFEGTLLHEGLITVDAHLRNFADLATSLGRKIGLIDYDDIGRGPYLLAIAKYFSSVDASPTPIKFKELWALYIDGLKNQEQPHIKMVEKALAENTTKDIEKAERILERFTKNDKFSYEENRPRPIKDLNPEVQQEFSEIRSGLEKALAPYKILDVAGYVKNGGGSRGQVRYWVLVNENGVNKIYEFKKLAETSLSLWGSQEPASVRFAKTNAFYWGPDTQPYKVVETPAGEFQLSQRVKKRLDFEIDDPNNSDLKNIDTYHRWLARQQGIWHGRDAEYRDYILKNEEVIRKQMKEFVRDYQEVLKQLHRRSNR
ncbi:MAG: hypothetical protein AB7O96_12050 [Pseudobdellovibrionaceae bacterium]